MGMNAVAAQATLVEFAVQNPVGTVPLKPHQSGGVDRTLTRWGQWAQKVNSLNKIPDTLWAGPGRLFAWDVGTGKTMAALHMIDRWDEWVQSLQVNDVLTAALSGPILIVSQARGRHVWEKEARKWYPELSSVMVTPETGKELRLAAALLKEGDVRIISTSYTALALNPGVLDGFRFSLCILDEIHELGNSATSRSQAIYQLMRLRSDGMPGIMCRLGLSGTPSTNKPDKLWPVLATLQGYSNERKTKDGRTYDYLLTSPKWAWDTRAQFETRYCDSSDDGYNSVKGGKFLAHDPERYVYCQGHNEEDCECLHQRMKKLVMDRVTRAEAWAEIKDPIIAWEEVPMTPNQKKLYFDMVNTEVLAALDDEKLKKSQVDRFALMTYAFEGAVSCNQLLTGLRKKHGDTVQLATSDGKLLSCDSSKLEWIVDFMESLDDDAAVIVFTEFARFAKEIATDPRLAKFKPLLLAGNSPLSSKQAEERFQNHESRLLVSTTKGTTAITLTAASYIVVAGKLSWGPIDYQQAIGRAPRPGQTKTVMVYLLYAPGTIEAWLRGKLARKLEDNTAVLDGRYDGADELSVGGMSNAQFINAFYGQ
jgi:SNF2 family DNA or RNA helicase